MSRNLINPNWHSTAQRKLLLDVFRELGGHIDAKELYRRAIAKNPNISMATVYRTLTLFKNTGIVDERHFGEMHCVYELKRESDHYHLVCKGCGKIVDIESPLMKRLLGDIKSKSGFKITKIELNLEGYCNQCKDKKT